MGNFDYLKDEAQFAPFADVAISAERVLHIDPESSILNCRRAMEFAIKWMYSVDKALVMPYQDNLHTLMHTEEFKDIVATSLWTRLELIRKLANLVAHAGRKITKEQAMLCLENLAIFMDFIACCYATNYEEHIFDASLVFAPQPVLQVQEPVISEADLAKLLQENEALKEELSARRVAQAPTYVTKPLNLSEYKTRKIYIDTMLMDVGWRENENWENEVELAGMPNASGVGYADYVLYDRAHKPLAVVEAKRTCVDVSQGRQQAKLYADLLEAKYGRRPVVFLTNGFETRIIDGQYPERRCATIYSERDLEKWFNLRMQRTSLKNIVVNKDIAGRYYQEEAIKAVCRSFDEKNRRKALLVMATGTGKTRTVIELCEVLLNAGWVKNVLFLADRNSLVLQAKRSFYNLLPDLSSSNLCEEKNYTAHAIFSTYQTMINLIDAVKDDQGKIFTCGHFDLVICDEAHRSIYNKYKDIFNYFDAPLVGLTATPKDEIDKNTYSIFDLESGVPTFNYDLKQAVEEKFLVDFQSIETQLKFLTEGMKYSELSDEDKARYEETFRNEDGYLPESKAATDFNKKIFNEDSIKKVLDILMEQGLKIDYGLKIGKTIIFARNHLHAEKILEVFRKYYPHLPNDFAQVIDNKINYAQSLIDAFSDPKKMPQIAISVDMLDTGIDVPEILNLVFFKKVMSKAKFWQMIGRGTRLCPKLLDGLDKEKFYIFDFCGNFKFFSMKDGVSAPLMTTLQAVIFYRKFQMLMELQALEYQTEELMALRKQWVAELASKVRQLNRENFAVRQHLQYVDLYAKEENYQNISYADTLLVREELSPLILPDNDEVKALRFDALLYGIELAYLAKIQAGKQYADLKRKVQALANIANIPEINAKQDLLKQILHTDYLERAGMSELEYIRQELRSLMKYVHGEEVIYLTNIEDEILGTGVDTPVLPEVLENYRKKAEYYVRQHQDNVAIHKLKHNIPLAQEDIAILEKVLWSELGTQNDYRAEYGDKALGEFVRELVGLDMGAAKEAFAEYLSDVNLDDRQIYFVNQIINHIVHNGMLKDFKILQKTPFNDRGSVVEIFTDISKFKRLKEIIITINNNAVA